ncbi:MAG: class I SAM-dependent methyltransferase [Patescibacteria group bacterium]|nr:class I SAM-dependent methyltransferase [Patescibacteria group bacterium]
MKRFIHALERVKYFGLRKAYYGAIRLPETLYGVFIDMALIDKKRHQSLIRFGMGKKLITEYGGDEGHNINTSQYFTGFGLIHYALMRNIRPKHILCIGSRVGFIPAILALACKDNGLGHVDFVDAGYDADSPALHWSGVGFWKHINPKKHFSHIGVAKHITTHVMTADAYEKKYPKKTYEYVYIDGDHSYKGVKKDYQLFWPKLSSGGFMAFHDIVAKGYLDKGKFGVWKLWRELSQKHAIEFTFPKDSGLGIIQKR